MSKKLLRLCSWIITLSLLINMLPLNAFATEDFVSEPPDELPGEVINVEQETSKAPTEAQEETELPEDLFIVDEVVENRSEFIKQFSLSNGFQLATVYANAVHYEVDGEWLEIDNTLKLSNTRAGNVYTNTAGEWVVTFPQSMTKNNGVTIEKDGYVFNFRMAGELHTAPSGDLEIDEDDIVVAPTVPPVEPVPEDDVIAASEPAVEETQLAAPEAETEISEEVTEAPAAETEVAEEATEVPAVETTEQPVGETTEIPAIEDTTLPSEEAATPVIEEETLNAEITEESELSVEPEEQASTAESTTQTDVLLVGEAVAMETPAESATGTVVDLNMEEVKASAEFEETVAEKAYSRISYANVYQNTDIIFDMISNQVKESIVINQYSETLYGYAYKLSVGELRPVLQENGQIDLYDADGKEIVMVMPAPYLMDSAGAYCVDVDVQLEQAGSDYVLAYILPQEWLADETRQWPVVLDPIVSASTSYTNIKDRNVYENGYHQTGVELMQCGYNTAQYLGKMRFYLKYATLPTLSSADMIVQASVKMYKVNAYNTPNAVEVHRVLETWDETAMNWDNMADFDEKVEDYAIVAAVGYYDWDITDIARGWYAGANTGMMFKNPDSVENGGTQISKQFYSAVANTIYRPEVHIIFRNNNGLESYWDYTTSSAGRAGTGYVNQYTGNLVWTRHAIGYGGNRMPVNINLVYNANDRAYNTYGVGYGWRTNYNQKVYQWSVNGNYYVWEDGDGTKHYFYNSATNTYLDEDGLELTLTTGNSGSYPYCIEDKYGNTSWFDSNGRLAKLTDNQQTKSSITIAFVNDTTPKILRITSGVGWIYTFSYSGANVSKITYTGNGTAAAKKIVSFGYSSSNLTTVTDPDERSSTYGYNTTEHLLTSVQDVDGYKLTYTYTTAAPFRVIKIAESDGTAIGGELNFSYAQNQTTITDNYSQAYKNVQIVQFNNWGNTVSVQDNQGHAQYARYALNDATENETSEYTYAKGNQLRLASKMQNTVKNYLTDTSFENSTTWYVTNTSLVSQAIDTSNAYHGSKSLKLTRATASAWSGGVYLQNITVEAGASYTFSAYVKGTAYLELNDGYKTYSGEEPEDSTTWTRLELNYTNPSDSDRSVFLRLMTVKAGTSYMDCVQFEKMPTASRYNLVQNGDFTTTSNWSSSAGRVNDTTTSSAAPQLDTYAYKLTGDPNNKKRISQTIPVKGVAGDSFVVAGWAKADSVPLDLFDTRAREFGIVATFNYTDGTKESKTARFNPYVESDVNWQYTATNFVAQKAYSSIIIELAYDYNANDAWFDGIQLFKEEFGTVYTYDENGNLVTATDTEGGKTEYTYDENTHDLTAIKLPSGQTITYEYDIYHNLTKSTSAQGVVTTYAYNQYGNNTSVTIGGAITSSSAYASGDRLTSTTDAKGNTTTYTYDPSTYVLQEVLYPNDTTATKTQYTYDSMLRMTQAKTTVSGGTTTSLLAQYTYNQEDQLTAIATNSTNYAFTYGNFSLRSRIMAGSNILADYEYYDEEETPRNSLKKLAYGNGDSVEYKYNPQGQVTTQSYYIAGNTTPSSTITYKYDNNGNLASVTDSASGITTTYYYDLSERLAKYRETGSDYDHISQYAYDANNNLTQMFDTVLGTVYKTYYYYDSDNRVSKVYDGGLQETYEYDAYGRLTTRVSNISKTRLVLTDTLTYEDGTSRVHTLTSTSVGDYNVTHTYEYDNNGNIVSDNFRNTTTTYVYDSANQLIRENNEAADKTWVWEYDNAGNILKRKEYDYTTDADNLGTLRGSISYTYDSSNWGDLLKEFGDKTVTSDTIGNITKVGNSSPYYRTYTWEHGRQLASSSGVGGTWNYTYNADGMRVKRTSGNAVYTYYYNGDLLRYLDYDSNITDPNAAAKLYFVMDANGQPIGVSYRPEGSTTTTAYYYVHNLQGDVEALVDYSTGDTVVTYTYDAWGNVLNVGGSMAETLGEQNPFRYRSYVYDAETELYYLQSRYYDPEMGRFINADALASTGQGLLGNNMFAYCNNNPVNLEDPNGNDPISATFAIIAPGVVNAVIVVAGIAVTYYAVMALWEIGNLMADMIQVAWAESSHAKEATEPEPPDVTYPGDDPAKAPEGYEWKGPDKQGGKRGGYKNSNGGKDSWHPDLDHPDGIGPHWDYNDGYGHKWRVFYDHIEYVAR